MTRGPRTYGGAAPHAGARQEILRTEGPLLSVIVRRPENAPPNEIALRHVEEKALIDTGASDVCIDMTIARRMRLPQIDQRTMGVVGGHVETRVYAGVLEIPELGFRKLMRLYSPMTAMSNYRILLGRSFLRDFILSYDGPTGIFTFYNAQEPYPGPIDDE